MPTVFITTPDGVEHAVDVPPGRSVLDACRKSSLPIDALCGGELDCSTCHVVIAEDWFRKLDQASEQEEDMLDLIPKLTDTSRLGCQVKVIPELDGLKVRIP